MTIQRIPEVTIEECAEVIQAITKVIRYGFLNNGYNNKTKLEEEIGQLNCMLTKLVMHWDLDTKNIVTHQCRKFATWDHWASFNIEGEPK